MGFILRPDFLGVTSFIRGLELDSGLYQSLLHFFHSYAFSLERLLAHWQAICFSEENCHIINSRYILLGDHCYGVKEGTKMPGVVTLHQNSETSSKPSYFRGHAWAFIAILLGVKEKMFATPLCGRIDQGLEYIGLKSGNDTLATRIVKDAIRIALNFDRPVYLVLDAFFAVGSVFDEAWLIWAVTVKEPFVHIITRAKKSIVAYEPLLVQSGKRKRGRPRKYGKSIKLCEVYEKSREGFQTGKCSVYGNLEQVKYLTLVLFWKPIQRKILFVLAETSRGFIVLMSSDLSITPLHVIELYCQRSCIESFFSVLKNVFGGFCYHFWSKYLQSQHRRPSKNKNIQTIAPEMKNKIKEKWEAIERFVNLCAITIGICQIISLRFHQNLWLKNTLWLRTFSNAIPSEFITKNIISKFLIKNFCNVNNTKTSQILLREEVNHKIYKSNQNFDNENNDSEKYHKTLEHIKNQWDYICKKFDCK